MRVAIIALAAVLGTAAPALADSAVGAWRTQGGAGLVEIAPCGAQLCGRLVDFPELRANPGLTDARNRDAAKRTRPLKGLPMLTGFTGGPRKWTGGTIYNPGDGRSYRSILELADTNTLKVKGCVGPICQTQTWTRAR